MNTIKISCVKAFKGWDTVLYLLFSIISDDGLHKVFLKGISIISYFVEKINES